MVYKRLNSIMKGNKLIFLISIITVALSALFSMLLPILIKFIIDVILIGNSSTIFSISNVDYLRNNMWVFLIIIIFLGILEGLFMFLGGIFSSLASENISKNLKNTLFYHIQKLPLLEYSKIQTGDLIQRCTIDIETIRLFYEEEIKDIAKSLFIIIFSFVILININTKLTIYSFITMPLIFGISFYFSLKINKSFARVDEKEAQISSILQENLTGVRLVKSLGNQKKEIDRFEKDNSQYQQLNINLCKDYAVFSAVSDFICFLQIGIVLFLGAYMVHINSLTLGELTVFCSYENMLIWPIRNLGNSLGQVGKVKVSINRIDDVLQIKNEEETETNYSNKPDLEGDIVLKDVCFEYEKGNKVLNNINITIKQGETVAILGETGAGKTTLMNILVRFFDYTSGSITINGNELKLINKIWIRENIGIVLQEPFLFSKTLEDNIMISSNYNNNLQNITKIADANDFILNFKEGYKTVVGERGVTLSGGQLQRVCIARTLAKRNKILILDDSLSAVDTQTDLNIRNNLKNNKECTTIIISSRVTTLMNADKIFIMEKGIITDFGSHEELIKKKNLYSDIWKIQNKLEIDNKEVV